MDITRKRIINPQRYLYGAAPRAINSISPYRWRRRTTRVFSFTAFFPTLRRGFRSHGGLQRP